MNAAQSSHRIVWIIAALAASGVSAQQMPQQLTLEEAQRLALLYNPNYRRAQNDVPVAEALIRQSYGSLLPNLNTSLGFSGGGSSSLTALDPFQRPLDSPQRVETTSSSADQGISTQVTLFDGGRNLRNISVAKASRRTAEARLSLQSTLLKAEVATNYYNALAEKRRVDLELNLLAARRDALDRTQKLLAVAASKYIDVLSARLDISDAEQAVEDARGRAEKARLQLKQSMGVEGPGAFELVTEPPAVFDPNTLNVESIVQRALASSPAVLASEAQVAASDKQASAARGFRWPTLTGNASFRRSSNARDYGAIGELNPPNRNWGFGVSVNLPIFSRFTTSYGIASADAAEADAREDLRLNRLQVDREVRSAIIDLQSAYRRVQSAEARAALQRERLAAGQEEYRLGTLQGGFLQLQQFTDAAAQGERLALDARFEFARALVALEQRINGPVER
jgi:outer membrane protein